MREKPFNFIATEKAEETVLVDENTEVVEENAKPEAAAEMTREQQQEAISKLKEVLEKLKPAPEKSFFEKYKVLLIILFVLAIVVFFWKFKIVSKAAQIVTA